MPSPILDSLPAIHTTVIGFGGAFFSAFALYAYQKVGETKDQLEKVLRDAEAFSTPTNYIGTQTDLLMESGELDWDGKAKRILHEAKSHFSSLDYEESTGFRSPVSSEARHQMSKSWHPVDLSVMSFTTYSSHTLCPDGQWCMFKASLRR